MDEIELQKVINDEKKELPKMDEEVTQLQKETKIKKKEFNIITNELGKKNYSVMAIQEIEK